LPFIRRRKLRAEHPVGETDSEHAFCWMLEQLRAAFPGGYPRDVRSLWKTIAELGGELGDEGKFNFLLADGRHLYARCGTKLCYIARKAPFGRATLSDAELQIDFAAFTKPRDRVAVVATVPLTRDEVWTQGTPGSMWVFRGGHLRATLKSGSPVDFGAGPENPVETPPARSNDDVEKSSRSASVSRSKSKSKPNPTARRAA
jgi:glutamine amidotransferase